MNATWTNLLSGGCGALIGAVASIVAAILTVKKGEHLKKEEDKKEKIRKFTAIKCEFEYLLERYQFVYGNTISETKDNQPISQLEVSKSEYFIIYKNNSDCIGGIDSSNLQMNIIKTYITSNSIMEEFGINNGIIRDISEKEKILDLHPSYRQHVDKEKLKSEIGILKTQLSDYGNTLRKDNEALIGYARVSIDGLNQEIECLKTEKSQSLLEKIFSFS